MMLDPVINGFSANELKINLHICYHSIITFFIRVFGLGFSNNDHVDSLYRFRKTGIDKVKFDTN